MKDQYYSIHQNQINLFSNSVTYSNNFTITIFKCNDSNCEICDLDFDHLNVGSQLCTKCKEGFSFFDQRCVSYCSSKDCATQRDKIKDFT